MNIDLFFDKLSEKTWRNNIDAEASRKFDNIIDTLIENKQEIIDDMINDVNRIEIIKNESNEEFSYATFKKWLDKYARENIAEAIREE